MKKLFISLVLAIALMFSIGASDTEASDLLYLGFNYEGNYGIFVGTGHSLGKVSIMPYARLSIDSTLTEDTKTRFTHSVGVETAIFLFEKPKYKFGLMASFANVDWVDKQSEPLGTYITQSAGIIGSYRFSEKFSLAGWFKGKTQLFASDTEYPKAFNAGVAATIHNFDLAKLLPF